MKRLILAMAFVACACFGSVSEAAIINLFEYGFNVDGTITSGSAPGNVSIAGFDTSTGLGTISATFSSTGTHYFGVYVDHEIDEAVNTFFNEFGSITGTPSPGQSWEIDEPGFGPVPGNIFGNFVSSALDNAIGFLTPEDVAMALGWDFSLLAGEVATISLRVSETPPPSGMYLTQFDPDSDASIYLSGQLSIRPQAAIPEPSTFVIMLGLMVAAVAQRQLASPGQRRYAPLGRE